MTDLKNELKKYHINYNAKIDEQKFVDSLHYKINQNKKNSTLKYSVTIFSLILILLNFMNPNETLEEEVSNTNFTESDINRSYEVIHLENDYLLSDSIYYQELAEAIFLNGDIWETLEFFDEINQIKEKHL